MGACREEGLDIPGDVSVIGFDNIETSKYIYPLLTTVHVPKGEQGELMATYLLSQIREKHGALHHRYFDGADCAAQYRHCQETKAFKNILRRGLFANCQKLL